MDKFQKEIMVIEKRLLFNNDYFQGFVGASHADFEARVHANFKFMKRGIAETDPNHKQPCAYSIIVNPTSKQVFTYLRASRDKDYTEKRLQGKWSIGLGGHIEKLDLADDKPIHTSMLRELSEEVHIGGSIQPRVLGYINDDRDDVGRVHFGVVYLIETDATDVRPNGSEIADGCFRTIDQLKQLASAEDADVEEWSKLLVEHLENYFKN
ncbi:NUDIX domain-containing protein [Candidatus Woesearchaeota archaeon]|nr:NUDIX domain-containing protein [Candidatus Woesearchaeota archaeon]